jgi:hypothetical protein
MSGLIKTANPILGSLLTVSENELNKTYLQALSSSEGNVTDIGTVASSVC